LASRASCRWRRSRLIVALGGLLLVLAVTAGLPVYVKPQIDPLRRADAIFILGGPAYHRYSFGFELGVQGWAPEVVVSNPNGIADPWMTQYCATAHHEFKLLCFLPDPPTTKGEGRELRRLAAAHGWRTVIVVTFRPHISRARFVLAQCFDGELVMVADPGHISIPRWAFQYIYQTAGFVRGWLQPGC
jgi:uncharacterized SAM-binding protein YcdF (DUF218 family)